MGARRCRFNASDVPAAHVSESALVCNTTGFAASGEASVEVSTNGREYTSSGVQLQVLALTVDSVAPWSGPTLGGTVVTLSGSGLARVVGAVSCHFGDGVSAASSHGVDGVRCVSPSGVPTGWLRIGLSMHGALLRSGASVHTLQHGCASVRAAHTLCGSPLLDEAHAAIKRLAASGGGAPCRVDACSGPCC